MEEISKDQHQYEEDEPIIQEEKVEELKQSLPNTTIMDGMIKLVNYQGFWYPKYGLKNIIAFQNHFKAQNSDIIIASCPKTGNTWLKALLFAIVNRKTTKDLALLHQKHPHELVYFLDDHLYGNAFEYPRPHHLSQLPSPRLFQTHMPYHSLPESIRTSGCRILYLTRNPLDTFVSMFYVTLTIAKKLKMGDEHHECESPNIESFVEECCYHGKSVGGPFFDHVLGYWKKSLEEPNKIMFLMYEDLKADSSAHVKKIAEFIGFPFTSQEESEGNVSKIIQLCSFKSLKELDVNKSGCINNIYEKSSFFRKGEVGDWRNYFTPQMVDSLMKFIEEKIDGSGLVFRFI